MRPEGEEGQRGAPLGLEGAGAGRAAALRALWVVGPGFTYAPFSRRFPAVEGRWRAALRAHPPIEGLPPGCAERPLPSDAAVVAGLKAAAAGAGATGGGPTCEGVLLLRELGLWPVVVAPAGTYCVALLPAVPPRALAEALAPRVRRGAGACGGDLVDRTLLSQTWVAAMGVARAVAALLLEELRPEGGGGGRAGSGSGQERALARAADFVQRALPFGVARDAHPSRAAVWHVAEGDGGEGGEAAPRAPPSSTQPAWKPVLLSGEKQLIRLDVVDTISGCVGPGYAVLRMAGTVGCQAAVDGCPALTAALDLRRPLEQAGLSLHPCAALLGEEPGQAGDAHAAGRCRVRFTPPLERFTLATYATEARPATLPLHVRLRLECPPPDARAQRGVSFHLELGLPPETRGLLEECSVVVRFPPALAVRNCLIAACSMGSTEAAEESGGGAFTIAWDLGHRLGQRSPRATLVGTCAAHPRAGEGAPRGTGAAAASASVRPLAELVGGPGGVVGWLRFRVERGNRSGVTASIALGEVPAGPRGGVVTCASGVASGPGGVEVRPEVTVAAPPPP